MKIVKNKFLTIFVIAMLSILSACGKEPQVDNEVMPTHKEENNDTEKNMDPTPTVNATNTPKVEPTDVMEPTNTPIPATKELFVYENTDGGVFITGINDRTITKLEIPEMINGMPVIGIADGAFADCNNIQNIVVDENIKTFTSRLTDGTECNAIIDINDNKLVCGCANTIIPNTIKIIGSSAFKGSSLAKIVIPATVETVGEYAFADCTLLSEVVIEGATEVSELAFQGSNAITKVTLSKEMVDYGWKNVFAEENITGVTLLEGITVLAEDLFLGCNNLNEVYIPASIMQIDEKTFKDLPLITISVDNNNVFYTTKDAEGKECNAIIDKAYNRLVVGTAETIIPSEITSIGSYAFFGRDLKELVIPETIETVGNDIYSYVEKLTIPYKVWNLLKSEEKISYYNVDKGYQDSETGEYSYHVYSKENIQELELVGDGVDYFHFVDPFLISQSYTLEKITLNEGITEISSKAFRLCGALSSIVIPEGVIEIDYGAFLNCHNLASIVLPQSLEYIRGSVFENCSSLTSIKIPEGVTRIDISAFEGCNNLTSITLPESISRIDSTAFKECNSLAIVYAKAGSFAAEWAKEKGYRVLEPQE